MGFIAKGEHIIVSPGQDGESSQYLFKVQNGDGSFSDAVWGTQLEDFESPVVSSSWTTYDSYKYISLGIVRQLYSKEHIFNRNNRFDSLLKVSTTVSPLNADISNIKYITAVVKGSTTEDANALIQKVLDEFNAGDYTDVLAIGRMNKDIDDYRPVNIDVNNIKTYASSAESTKDYNLPISEAIYLVNIALMPNADMESINSLALNVYGQEFVEFASDAYVAPGTVGKTEIDPDYKAERAINNHIIVINDSLIVDSGTTIVISPDEATQIDNNSIYYMYLNTSDVSNVAYISLGYYDMEAEEYVSSGEKYPVTISGTVVNKVCIAVNINNSFKIKAL